MLPQQDQGIKMAQLGKYLRKLEGGYGHWCPGCSEMHYIAVETPLSNGAKWSFNGDIDKPTFSPSVKIQIPVDKEDEKNDILYHFVERCHYFIKEGNIEYCNDCTHDLKGQTIPLPEWPEGE